MLQHEILKLILSTETKGGPWSMAAPQQLVDVKVKVESKPSGKPLCLLDLKVAKDQSSGIEKISLEMSPETLLAAVESLNKVRAQLDSIAKKTSA
ncbi:COMM domain-containing protein 9-like [Palaemon carinicauda]|uniref:COMM domain-containing protein 9-like n=1 Tax=Palaemon carinicauda TaxID=392227 RepID=UPI0035B612B1